MKSHLEALCVTEGKVILETHLNSFFFLYRYFKDLNPANLYIVCDKFEDIIRLYKTNLEQSQFDGNILYIASDSDALPLMHNSVDVLIDYNSSNEHSIFSESVYLNNMSPFIKDSGRILCTYFSFDRNSRSLKNLNRSYPENNPDNYYYPAFLRSLEKDFIYTEQRESGICTDSGEGIVFIFHQTGEKLYIHNLQLEKRHS